MDEALTGRLLVATPLLTDPNFARAVVLLCAHHAEGAFGIVINRPLAERVGAHLPQWERRVGEPPVFFAGGPVQPTTVIALGRDRSGVAAPWWTRVTAEVGLIDLRWEPADLSSSMQSVRLFAGYAGWGGGQLEREIEEQAWFVVDAAPGDAFTPVPERLWREVLRRQAGPLAMFSTYPEHDPEHPSLN